MTLTLLFSIIFSDIVHLLFASKIFLILPFYLFHPFILLLLYGTLIVYEGKCHNRTKNKANPARIVRQDSPFRLQNVDFYLFVLKRSPLSQGWVQNLLADAQTLRGHLQKLIRQISPNFCPS